MRGIMLTMTVALVTTLAVRVGAESPTIVPLGMINPCDDGDVCTDDATAEGGGCTHTPVAGTCWVIDARPTIAASYRGATCRCRLRPITSAMVLYDDGRFRSPGGRFQCPTGIVTVPDAVGTWTAGKRGRIRLDTTNAAEVRAAAAQCAGETVGPNARQRERITLSADGRQLRYVSVTRGASQGVNVAVTSRGKGTIVTTTLGRGTTPAQVFQEAQRCGGPITRCLRDKLS